MLDRRGKQARARLSHWRLFLYKSVFCFSSLGFVLCCAQGFLGLPFRKTISLAPSKIEPVAGFAYAYSLPRKYSPSSAQIASARLRENGTILSSYSPRETSVIAVGQGTFTVSKEGRLIISATDNSDPRINGRQYSFDTPLRVSKNLLPISLALWLTTSGLLFWNIPNRREVAVVWGWKIKGALRPIIAFLGLAICASHCRPSSDGALSLVRSSVSLTANRRSTCGNPLV